MESKRIVEINGIKLEVDLRHCKTIEEYKIGDPVKVLVKEYGDSYQTKYGRIIDFNEFQSLPTIVVAYIDLSYSEVKVKLVNLNSNSKEVQISPMHNLEIGLELDDIVESLDRRILKSESELKKEKDNKHYVLTCFEKYFKKQKES